MCEKHLMRVLTQTQVKRIEAVDGSISENMVRHYQPKPCPAANLRCLRMLRMKHLIKYPSYCMPTFSSGAEHAACSS